MRDRLPSKSKIVAAAAAGAGAFIAMVVGAVLAILFGASQID